MKDAILVPCWERPEMLYHCLQHLAEADGIEACQVFVMLDAHKGWHQHETPDFNTVIKQYPHTNLEVIRREPSPWHGNSSNVLLGYRMAYERGCEFTFLVEEDVLVSKDFLRWHYAVMHQGDWFCSIGTQCTRRKDWPKDGTASQFWTSGSDYASLGVCFPRSSLRHIVPHATDNYFRSMVEYITRRFPNSRFRNSFHEQDGLIMRIMDEVKGTTAWPCVPRAWHCGFWGYNRRDKKPFWEYSGLADKIRFCGDLLRAPTELKKLTGKFEDDVNAPDYCPREWENVELIARLP